MSFIFILITKSVMKKLATILLFFLAGFTIFGTQLATRLNGSIPVLDNVDVVIVGGTSGGVQAAVSAAKAGARVFLICERSFAGEDICSTYRLWLEPDESPITTLAKEAFKPVEDNASFKKSDLALVPFTYNADKPSAKPHKDSESPGLLSDGKWKNAATESVQYDDENVNIIVRLNQETQIAAVHLLVYQRAGDFEVERVSVSNSSDGQNYEPLAEIRNQLQGAGNYENEAIPLSTNFKPKTTRFLKLSVHRPKEAKRMLLGEIIIEKAETKQNTSTQSPTIIRPVTPMQIKRVFDKALIDSEVRFLFCSYPIDVIRDSNGRLGGIIIANRSGQQAILAKTIIDATMHSVVAKMAGVKFSAYPTGIHQFYSIVIGGEEQKGERIQPIKRQTPIFITVKQGESYPVREYNLFIQMNDDSIASIAQVEQIARDLTWTKDCVDASEILFGVPKQSFKALKTAKNWKGPEKLPIDCFRPVKSENLFVLNGTADVPPHVAEKLMRPVNLMAVGERIGLAAAKLAKITTIQPPLKIGPDDQPKNVVPGEVRFVEQAFPFRIEGSNKVPQKNATFQVLGEYDVAVVGGGTGGAPAAIASGRAGARTLLIEHLYSLGGVGTAGLISSYYHGNRVGFTKEVDAGVGQMGGIDTQTSSSWIPDIKSEWYRRELRKANVDIWFGSVGTGALVHNNKVNGVVVLTPAGVGVVLAKVVIDATGNADIAAAAGAKCKYTDDSEVAIQGAGLPKKEPCSRYTNTDYTFVDDSDIVDIWRVFVIAREKFKWAYDLGQLIDTRERRQIFGDYTLTPMDIMMNKTFHDTIVICHSDFDSHGHTIHPMFMLRPPDRTSMNARVPFRAMLPAGIEGIIVTGLGVSAHRDALPVIRMQADVQNQGYAAGLAAATVAKQNIPLRQLNIRQIQEQLVAKGILPESILNEEDSTPSSDSEIAAAASVVKNNYDKLEIILAYPDRALPIIESAFKSETTFSNKLIYAHILGMFSNNIGVDVLIEAIKKTPQWDKGWRFTGMGQYGASISPLDSYIIAAGKTRDPKAFDPILEKANLLTAQSEFSHFRAIAIAFESLNDERACPILAKILQMPGISGHAVTDIKSTLSSNPPSDTDTSTRNAALTELVLARALFKCGDYQKLGEHILKQYAKDLHGHYARHAYAVLLSKLKP